jgi:acyl transferase domain-containing protein/acyl-CoA synthetase (AMP-forming)/AMP-acid ligase II/acyl carrier protein
MGTVFTTLVELLRHRAAETPERLAYTFLGDDGEERSRVTDGELDLQARAIAAGLQERCEPGDRVVLLYPPGLEFTAAFFGCLYAGVIAVPAYPPDPSRIQRTLPRLLAVIKDAQPTLVLSLSWIQSVAAPLLAESPELQRLGWLASDEIPADGAGSWRAPRVDPSTLAFLQYTSGSTSTPKGVMVSHGNLVHNEELIRNCFEHSEESTVVGWLPLYHDMGLIGNMLQPLWVRSRCILFSPIDFLRNPVLWVQTISRYHAKTSGGPSFAYELCARKATAEQRQGLDLSSWTLAYNGAEPIRAETLDRFVEVFGPCGFRREAFYPCYGLAEGTLIASGGSKKDPPIVKSVDGAELGRHRVVDAARDSAQARLLVGCGRSLGDESIAIVDPETGAEAGPGRTGEIWVSGGSVAQGYWGRPEETERTFRARLPSGNGPFLRTGDLGFLEDGELFVTGRLKDLIIIRGRNHYPQDLEWSVERSHPAIRPGCGAAFSIEEGGEERLVLVAEVDRRLSDPSQAAARDEIAARIVQAVAEEHEIRPHAVLLLPAGSIPKTSSGKIQRYACRSGYLAGSLEALTTHVATPAEEVAPAPAGPAGTLLEVVQRRIVEELSSRLGVSAAEIDVREPFARYGLDSLVAVELAASLEDWLGRPVAPTLVYDYPNIEALSRHLSGAPGAAERAPVRAAGAEPVAIVGLACRFPGAPDAAAFWRLLTGGVDAIRVVPPDRWNIDDYFDPDPAVPGKMSTRFGGFLESVDGFDPIFFGISPREAARMDPQQRLLLEVAWEALEDAGIPADGLAGAPVGVFVGICNDDYGRLQLTDPALSDAYVGTGSAFSIAANRLSYFFDFRGPSVAMDTACSSSLVAVHAACQSLARGEAEIALAGGVNLILTPEVTVNFSKAGFMSPDGRCKAFAAKANGYVRGEGAGMVVLKPLSRAVADGDPIYAVIRGSAVNQDGRTNGITAPNELSQRAVLRDAYRRAGVSPADIQYVEAHGTGTPLGDPIEAKAIGAVLSEGRKAGSRCAVGSVKSNIGHLESAAGVAAIIKVALMLTHREIPRTLHFEEPNPHIPFAELPLEIAAAHGPWPAPETPGGRRLAGVSSFGFGGTNAHVVLEEPPAHAEPMRSAAPSAHLLPLSARTQEALKALAATFAERLSGPEPESDVCYTAGVRRSHHDRRVAVVGGSKEELAQGLRAFAAGEEHAAVAHGRRIPGQHPRVAFVFCGQGAQWVGMGRALFEEEPVFRGAIERCDGALRAAVGWSVREELFAPEERSRLADTEVAQPALFALQVALAELWRTWGISPEAVVGHSIGEVAAAHVAGALSFEDAVRLVARRGQIMQRATGRGKMAAVGATYEEAKALIAGEEERLSVAAVNGPAAAVLSGEPAPLQAIEAKLEARGIFFRWLPVNYAFHSPQMDGLDAELEAAMAGLRPREASMALASTALGGLAKGPELDAVYWGKQIRRPVLFAAAIDALANSGIDTFLEVGPHPVLASQIAETVRGKGLHTLASLRRGEPERGMLLRTLSALYAQGAPVDWANVGAKGRCISLPAYPWQRVRSWIDSLPRERTRREAGRILRSARASGESFWEAALETEVLRQARSPVALLGIALGALRELLGGSPPVLSDVEFRRIISLSGNGTHTVQVVLSPAAAGKAIFSLYSRPEGSDAPWTLLATGKVHSSSG